MIMSADPFSMVYTGLWDLAESSELLTNRVKLRNRIRYDLRPRDPEKRQSSDADYPELALWAAGLTGNLWNTSSTSMVVRRYTWLIMTGDLRINLRLMPVEWALFVAMHGWNEVLTGLRWNDKAFVKRCNVLDVEEGILRPTERQEGPLGWTCLWGIDVEMHFAVNDILTLRG